MEKLVLKFTLLSNCFSDLCTKVEIWYWNNFKFALGLFLERQKKSSLNMALFEQLSPNKNIKSKRKFYRKSVCQYFETFQCVTKFPLTTNGTICDY